MKEGLQFINKKLNFTNSLNNEISQRDSKLIEIYFLIKKKNIKKQRGFSKMNSRLPKETLHLYSSL